MSKIKVLVVFANPRNTNPLRLGTEDRAIQQAIRRSRYRDTIEITKCHAATIHDIRQSLLDEIFQIVHISGHGIHQGLVLEDDLGNEKIIPQKALADLFKVYSPPLQCVILNACYTISQGKLISFGVPFTIAMEGPIDDEGAIEFSRGFYDAIGAGRAIDFAYGEGQRTVALSVPNAQFLSKMLRKRTKSLQINEVREESFMEYAQQFCAISNPNGEQSIYRMVKGQDQVTIGRLGDEPNDITLGPNHCTCISRRHCLLLKKDGKWWLIRKGRYYPLIRRKTGQGEEEVHTEVQLADGDLIRILGETSKKGDISWIIRFCDGATTQPVSMAAFLRYDKQQKALYRVLKGSEQLISLSGKERDLADFMLKHPGFIYGHEELIRAIWKNGPPKTRENLRTLIYRLRDKIEPPGTGERFLISHPAFGYSLHTQPIDEKE